MSVKFIDNKLKYKAHRQSKQKVSKEIEDLKRTIEELKMLVKGE